MAGAEPSIGRAAQITGKGNRQAEPQGMGTSQTISRRERRRQVRNNDYEQFKENMRAKTPVPRTDLGEQDETLQRPTPAKEGNATSADGASPSTETADGDTGTTTQDRTTSTEYDP